MFDGVRASVVQPLSKHQQTQLHLNPAFKALKMPFIDVSKITPIEAVPGCRMRTPFGQNLMLSYLEMDEGAVVPLHSHPHEQGGMLLKGRIELTIGDEQQLCEAGSMFLIPPNTPHKAVAVGGPAVVLDVFSPVREDYAEMYNKYIPTDGSTK
jgi:quercetin dioxygenase-like cupin family protein